MLYFQDIIFTLKKFWADNGCSILEGFDMPVGAGTLAPYTALRVPKNKNWKICQVQYCRRPTDGRFGENPNRSSAYYQMQVILKPAPENIQELCIKSLESVGITREDHDIKFMEDDWANPSIGASGLGYEVWCDGMEVLQFTYMQRLGGVDIPAEMVAGEITYGLERLAMYIQNKDNYLDIEWSKGVKYNDINSQAVENEMCCYYQQFDGDTEFIKKQFENALKTAHELVKENKKYVAYEYCLQASHLLNILDARHLLSDGDRKNKIFDIHEAVAECIK